MGPKRSKKYLYGLSTFYYRNHHFTKQENRVHTLTIDTSDIHPEGTFWWFLFPVHWVKQSLRWWWTLARAVLHFFLHSPSQLSFTYLPCRGGSSILKPRHTRQSYLPLNWKTVEKLKCLLSFRSEDASLPLLARPEAPGHSWVCRMLSVEGLSQGKVQVCWRTRLLDFGSGWVQTLWLGFWNESAAQWRPLDLQDDLLQQPPTQEKTAR